MSSSRATVVRSWIVLPAQQRAQESELLLDPVLAIGVFALLLFGPIAFGGVEEWAVLVLEVGAAVLFGLWYFRQLRAVKTVQNPLYRPACLFGLLILCQIAFRSSVYVNGTLAEALRYAAYGLVVFLSVQCSRGRNNLKYLALVFTTFGFLFAVFAIIQSFTGTFKIYWLRMPSDPNSVIFGSYVNHNHYAGLMELLTPFPLMLSLSGVWHGAKRILCSFAATVMAASLFLSKSRGGMIAFAVQLAFVVALVLTRRSKRLALAFAIAGVLLVGSLLWLDASGLVRERVSSLTDPLGAAGTRLTIVRDGIKMFRAKPVLGWGLDTFPIAYPRYRSFSTDLFINAAHNDYLQVLAETGIVGFVLMLWFVCSLYANSLPQTREWTHDLRSTGRTAALVACTGILVHSFSDFNLHVPANAALFFALAAVATTGEGRRRRRLLERSEPRPKE